MSRNWQWVVWGSVLAACPVAQTVIGVVFEVPLNSQCFAPRPLPARVVEELVSVHLSLCVVAVPAAGWLARSWQSRLTALAATSATLPVLFATTFCAAQATTGYCL